MGCPKKIRPFHSINPLEIECGLSQPHITHQGEIRDHAYPGSLTKLYWHDDDRRTFAGTWTDCDESKCILPAGHRGEHALR